MQESFIKKNRKSNKIEQFSLIHISTKFFRVKQNKEYIQIN